VSADEPEITAYLHLQQFELNVEIQLREKFFVERYDLFDTGRSGKRLADHNSAIRLNAPDEVEIGFVQTELIGPQQMFDVFTHRCLPSVHEVGLDAEERIPDASC
jgi:hypothetical protein